MPDWEDTLGVEELDPRRFTMDRIWVESVTIDGASLSLLLVEATEVRRLGGRAACLEDEGEGTLSVELDDEDEDDEEDARLPPRALMCAANRSSTVVSSGAKLLEALLLLLCFADVAVTKEMLVSCCEVFVVVGVSGRGG